MATEIYSDLERSGSFFEDEKPMKKGYLMKLGGQKLYKTWKRRYFILFSDFLYYYSGPKDPKPRGIIYLEGCAIEKVEKYSNRYSSLKKKNPAASKKSMKEVHALSLTTRTGKTFYLTADLENEMNSWIHVLRETRDRYMLGEAASDRIVDLESQIKQIKLDIEEQKQSWDIERNNLESMLQESSSEERSRDETTAILKELERMDGSRIELYLGKENKDKYDVKEHILKTEVTMWQKRAKGLRNSVNSIQSRGSIRDQSITTPLTLNDRFNTITSTYTSSSNLSIPSFSHNSKNATLWIEIEELQSVAENLIFENNLSEAERVYKRALYVSQTAEGRARADSAWILNNVGVMYAQQCRFDEGKTNFELALSIFKDIPGEEKEILNVLNSWSNMLQIQKKYDEAIEKCSQALEIIKKIDSENICIEKAVILYNVASLYEMKGSIPEAEMNYIEALRLFQASSGADTRDRADAAMRLGKIYKNQEKYAQSQECLVLATNIYADILGRDSKSYLVSRKLLKKLRKEMGAIGITNWGGI